MRVEIVKEDKEAFMDLLLLADEEKSMIYKYLERGTMFSLYDEDLKGICVVTKEENGVCELKNLAVYEKFQGKGYGKALVYYIFNYFKKDCHTMYVGTGDSPLTIPFYKRCGFVESHRVKNFFIDNYKNPIYEGGKRLVHMVYLKKELV